MNRFPKFQVVFPALSLALSCGTALAADRACELPHQLLAPECAAASAELIGSGIEKPRKSAQQLLEDYKRRSQSFGALVAKADEDYKAFLAKRR